MISTFVEAIDVMSFDQAPAARFGVIAAALAQRGGSIDALDTLIAADAFSLPLTFVTNNTKRFARVSGLATENWV